MRGGAEVSVKELGNVAIILNEDGSMQIVVSSYPPEGKMSKCAESFARCFKEMVEDAVNKEKKTADEKRTQEALNNAKEFEQKYSYPGNQTESK